MKAKDVQNGLDSKNDPFLKITNRCKGREHFSIACQMYLLNDERVPIVC